MILLFWRCQGSSRACNMKMTRLSTVFAALVAANLLIGCAGAGAEEMTGANAFAGTYLAAYSRADGSVTVAVDSTSQVTITIVDSVEGTFVGSGSVNHVGGFFVTCQGKGGKTITVNGTLKGSGIGRTAGGTVTGSVAFPYTASFLSNPDATIYTNAYQGSYKVGADSQNWLGEVSSSGNFSGTLLLADSKTVAMTGKVYSNGSITATGSAEGTSYSMRGSFWLKPGDGVHCAGLLTRTVGSASTVGEFSGHISME